ncbi:MAG: DNA polymerase I [Burkholderiaceae bacterium]|nr:DNA polymerase I [Burkholderiaceae bacterium]
MRKIWCDLETFSPVPISQGTHRYAEKARVLLWGYKFENEPAKVWDIAQGEPMPKDLKAALENPEFVTVWHNGAMFDTVVLKHALGIDLPLSRIDDTMVKAYSHSLPGSLSALCDVLRVPNDKAKDKDGRRLIRLFCVPDRNGHVQTHETRPEDWKRFVEYCRLDVEALAEIDQRLPEWNWQARDHALFELDQQINRRGICIDTELAQACVDLAEKTAAINEERAKELTNGELSSARQRDAVLKHILKEYGVTLPDLTKSTVERRLNDPDLPQAVKDLLAVRLSSTRTSIAKYKALLGSVSSDGRLRGTLQFRGASRTGRYSGRLFQPQNLARPTLSQTEIDVGIDAIKGGWTDLLYDDPSELMSSCLRGVIVASPGKQLVVADLSNIEGRVLAWLAKEDWKLQAFREFDAGRGPDLYKATYGRTFGVNPNDVTKKQRQIGKVLELAMGYQGGVGAFLTFASVYRVDLDELAKHTFEAIDPQYLIEARDAYPWFKEKGLTHGLAENTFIACEAIKRAWRAAHPAITKYWADTETAIREALTNGSTNIAGRIVYDKKGAWLRARLPSGRYLCYPAARLPNDDERCAFIYKGMNQYTRKWDLIKTYGGKCCENAGQAVACDILVEAMPVIEAAGFEIVISVHDEFITEAPMNKSAKELESIMATAPAWAKDLPLAAAGFESQRYRKE